MSWIITPTYDGLVTDPDANTYLAAVQAADGQLLEPDVRIAVNNFIVGCKADGIWDAIKASCILAGARTLAGALVPLVGTAPTNYNFVSGDYDRETGLKGDGTTKYLDSNRNNNADPQDSNHNAIWISTNATSSNSLLGAGLAATGANTLQDSTSSLVTRSRHLSGYVPNVPLTQASIFGTSRSSGTGYTIRNGGVNYSAAVTSTPPVSTSVLLFARGTATSPNNVSDARLAFYSIGESLDLALLDARVTTLISDLAAAIP